MKVITLWQPWATLIALGVKIHETRSWSTTYRGPLAIHAAKRPICEAGRLVLLQLRRIDAIPFGIDMPLGNIVALTDLTRVVSTSEAFAAWTPERGSIYAVADTTADHICGDFAYDRFAWRLDNVRRCNVPHKGTQGIRDLPEDTARLVREATQGT